MRTKKAHIDRFEKCIPKNLNWFERKKSIVAAKALNWFRFVNSEKNFGMLVFCDAFFYRMWYRCVCVNEKNSMHGIWSFNQFGFFFCCCRFSVGQLKRKSSSSIKINLIEKSFGTFLFVLRDCLSFRSFPMEWCRMREKRIKTHIRTHTHTHLQAWNSRCHPFIILYSSWQLLSLAITIFEFYIILFLCASVLFLSSLRLFRLFRSHLSFRWWSFILKVSSFEHNGHRAWRDTREMLEKDGKKRKDFVFSFDFWLRLVEKKNAGDKWRKNQISWEEKAVCEKKKIKSWSSRKSRIKTIK